MKYIEKIRFDLARRAIIKTLTYSDIFDFPLSFEELWEYLVSDIVVSKELFGQAIDKLLQEGYINYDNKYYCLEGRKKNIQKRHDNLPEVSKKLEIAQKAASLLSYIPTIQLIGISGGLAMYDADKDDDIDFFVIAKNKTLFITRIWILGILQILKLRRTRLDKNPANKICVNFMLDEEKLNFPKHKRDIYIAHEIAQVKPLFEREDTYRKFLRANSWIKRFFPNAEPQNSSVLQKQLGYDSFKAFIFLIKFHPLEDLLKRAQIRYLRQHQTIEKVSDYAIAFHPNDYRVQTIKKMNLKLRQLGLLTNI